MFVMLCQKLIRNFKKHCICKVIVISVLYYVAYYSGKSGREYLEDDTQSDFKQILVWADIEIDPIKYLGDGNKTFVSRSCKFTNCYVSSTKPFYNDVTKFDVIVFHGPAVNRRILYLINKQKLPKARSPHQKYVFASMESATNYPVCVNHYNNYFNWTWTYKLNSDEYFGYVAIRDKEGKVVGPKEVMHWERVEDMTPISDTLRAKLSTKKLAAAWFVSNCGAPSGRDFIANNIKDELAKYNMTVDIYGKCGTKTCPRNSMVDCLRRLEEDYYFYFSFENTLSEDYVTEKLLRALTHYTVPVVYGGANYTRFMPDGIYMVAKNESIRTLAKEMVDVISDKERYYDFFKWHNHYSYHHVSESPETDSYCKLCAMINDDEKYSRLSSYEDFDNWWNSPYVCFNNDSILMY